MGVKELFSALDRWHKGDMPVAVARVVDLDGSGPRLPGARGVLPLAHAGGDGCDVPQIFHTIAPPAVQVLRDGQRLHARGTLSHSS